LIGLLLGCGVDGRQPGNEGFARLLVDENMIALEVGENALDLGEPVVARHALPKRRQSAADAHLAR
jgi:hypothetical protein